MFNFMLINTNNCCFCTACVETWIQNLSALLHSYSECNSVARKRQNALLTALLFLFEILHRQPVTLWNRKIVSLLFINKGCIQMAYDSIYNIPFKLSL